MTTELASHPNNVYRKCISCKDYYQKCLQFTYRFDDPDEPVLRLNLRTLKEIPQYWICKDCAEKLDKQILKFINFGKEE